MRWAIDEGPFWLVGFDEAPRAADLEALAKPPGQLVREVGETTLLVRAAAGESILERHPEARVERDLFWVRFESPMSWEVVGFLAHVTSELARRGIPLGAISGFSRDHLFIAGSYRVMVEQALSELFPR